MRLSLIGKSDRSPVERRRMPMSMIRRDRVVNPDDLLRKRAEYLLLDRSGRTTHEIMRELNCTFSFLSSVKSKLDIPIEVETRRIQREADARQKFELEKGTKAEKIRATKALEKAEKARSIRAANSVRAAEEAERVRQIRIARAAEEAERVRIANAENIARRAEAAREAKKIETERINKIRADRKAEVKAMKAEKIERDKAEKIAKINKMKADKVAEKAEIRRIEAEIINRDKADRAARKTGAGDNRKSMRHMADRAKLFKRKNSKSYDNDNSWDNIVRAFEDY